MSLATLVFAYLLGGVTFLPLLIAITLILLWYCLPTATGGDHEPHHEGGGWGDLPAGEKDGGVYEGTHTIDGSASAIFAVLRTYNFPLALAALNARATSSTGTDGGLPTGGSESVYQSMYRSVFDRGKPTGTGPRVLLDEDPTISGPAAAKSKNKPANNNVFYIVLRHGHLMLYDSPAQLEVRHVISLAHHTVSISEGQGPNGVVAEADLFIKRTAILLEPAHAGTQQLGETLATAPKPFYLFSTTCSDKEDFYHALLSAQARPPTPQQFSPDCAIKLQSTLHSTILTPETRAINAMIGRMFLALHRTDFLESLIRHKIEKKIARVQKPAFVASLAVRSIDLGTAAPVLFNPRLIQLHISGDLTLALDVRYSGGLKLVISAVAKLELGQRFKARTVDLVLSGILQRLQGHILLRIKPPPSNRIWLCFDTMPEMDLKIEPEVSTRQITYTFILRAIESRIREVVAETLVKPNWDDIPFFHTEKQNVRGGIWKNEGCSDDTFRGTPSSGDVESVIELETPDPENLLAHKNEKTMSMPALNATTDDEVSTAASSGLATPVSIDLSDLTHVRKRRSVGSFPAQHKNVLASADSAGGTSVVSRTPRAPSFTTPLPASPVVAVNGSHVDAVRGEESDALRRRWTGRAPQAQNRKAVEAVRAVHDQDFLGLSDHGQPSSPRDTPASIATNEDEAEDGDGAWIAEPDEFDIGSPDSAARPQSNTGSTAGNVVEVVAKSSDTRGTSDVASEPSRALESSPQHWQPRGKNILAATAAATSAARQWTWNAVQNRAKLAQGPSQPSAGPIGRGHPLPPPGTPLPGPQRSLWPGLNAGSVKRKPVLPPRRPDFQNPPPTQETETGPSRPESARSAEIEEPVPIEVQNQHDAEDAESFGPWSENHGHQAEIGEASLSTGDDVVSTGADVHFSQDLREAKDARPPLPPRHNRSREAEEMLSSAHPPATDALEPVSIERTSLSSGGDGV